MQDSLSDDIESILDDLEENPEGNSLLARLNPDQAGKLAQLIRKKIANDREKAGADIEQELTVGDELIKTAVLSDLKGQSLCPPREVRNFRVLAVQDARTQRRHGNRVAQLTVWDVLNLRLSEEGEAGKFQAGQSFRVSTLYFICSYVK